MRRSSGAAIWCAAVTGTRLRSAVRKRRYRFRVSAAGGRSQRQVRPQASTPARRDGREWCLVRLVSGGAAGTALRQKTIDLRHGQIARGQLPPLQPVAQIAQIAQQPSVLVNRSGRVSLPPHFLPKVLRQGRERAVLLGAITMKSPRFKVKEKTLPALSPMDYADPDQIGLKSFRSLQTYLGIIRTSA